MEFNELIRARFSCRALSDKAIPQEALHRILEAARLAPTAVNKQPFKVWVAQSADACERLAETTNYTFGAGIFLILGAKEDEAWVRSYDGRNFADVDAAIAATHIMLAIQNEGLGSTWIGHFDAPKLKEAFPMMEGYDLIAIFPIGFPTEKGVPSPRQRYNSSFRRAFRTHPHFGRPRL